jgi:ribonuclease D
VNWQLVQCDAALAEAFAAAEGAPAVAIDTEFMRRNTFFPQVALLQLCFDDVAWLVDPLTLDDLEPLRRLMRDPACIKVLHSASEDLEVFQHWLGVLPGPMFDTQRAAALLDRGFGLGYRSLVQDLFGIELPKGETRSDWLRRPLSQSQCDYAAQDVAHLLPIWELLGAECRNQGKFDWVLEDGEAAAAGLASGAGDYYRRIKSAWKLPPRALAALVALSDWRERVARERDRPRNWIVDDKALLQIAEALPDSLSSLARLELPEPALRRYGKDWVALLAPVRDLSEAELPDPLPAPLGPAARAALKRLKQRALVIAGELSVAPEALLPARDFELLLRQADGDPAPEPRHWSGWRGERVIAPLRAALAGG